MRHHNLSAYIASFVFGATLSLTRRTDIVSKLVIFTTLIFIFYGIFKAMPVHELGNAAITSNHLLWYFAFTEIIVTSVQGNERELGRTVSEGQLTTLMQRPGSMMGLLLARVAGIVSMNMVVLFAYGITLMFFVTGELPPVQTNYIPLLVVSILLGASIFMLMGYAIGAFEILGPYSRPINWIINKLIFTFGGLFFPVIFFPKWLQQLVALTPCPSVIFAPGSFMLETEFSYQLWAVGQQIIWLGIMFMIARMSQNRMFNYVLVKGD